VPELTSQPRNIMDFIQRTIEIARANVEEGGRPFCDRHCPRRRDPRREPQPCVPDNRPHRARRDPRDPRGLYPTRYRAPDRVHHLRARPSLPDVPGLAGSDGAPSVAENSMATLAARAPACSRCRPKRCFGALTLNAATAVGRPPGLAPIPAPGRKVRLPGFPLGRHFGLVRVALRFAKIKNSLDENCARSGTAQVN
jgi:hypothetical protein